MQLSDKGLEFIADFEGYHDRQADGSCKPYRCQAGVLTIGYGCTEGVTEDMHWTRTEALEAFKRELVEHEAAVAKAVKTAKAVTQDQFDALVSFSYNCGVGSMQKVAKVLSTEGAKAASAKMLEYTKFTNPKTRQLEVSRGLVRRRAAEARLMEPDDTPLGTMPQAVAAPPKRMSVKESIVKVGAPVVAVGEGIRQATVPQGVKDAISNAKELQSVGGEIAVIGKSAWSAALAYPILAAVLVICGVAYVWLNKRSEA